MASSAVHTCPNNPSTGSPTDVPVYALNSCLSQNQTAQLAATVCTGTGACTSGSANDITCNAGHLIFIPQNTNVVSVDQNGVATAHQPGSTVINATIAQATSTAGYFFTCPAKSIQLSVGTTGQKNVTVNTNDVLQPLTTTILDTNGNAISGLQLQYTSNDPINIPVSNSGSVTPAYPSDAAIVAQCLPSVCNPAPQDQIGNLSTGLPVGSNPSISIRRGRARRLFTCQVRNLQHFLPVVFKAGKYASPIRLPYQPNSMVMDENGNEPVLRKRHGADDCGHLAYHRHRAHHAGSRRPGTVLAVAPE